MDLHILNGIPAWTLLVGGAALGWIKNFWGFIYEHSVGYLVRKLYIALSVEEQETEEAYIWLNLWAEKRIREKKITDLLLRRKDTSDGRIYHAVPHYGTYYLRFKKRYMLVFTSSSDSTPGGSGGGEMKMSMFRPRRTIQITIWGTLNREIITELLREAREEFYAQLEKKFLIYRNEGSWWESRELFPRALDTIYLPEATTNDIVDSAEQFLAIKDKYRQLGIPWRYGFLFHGPPGTGKSSLVQALATHLELPVYYLNLNTIEQPEHLQRLINAVSSRSILLIEDVDCIPAARERKVESSSDATVPHDAAKGIIASDLLNVIDGVVATEGRLLIMTTNHRGSLDPALLRKGRVDREFHITWAADEELERFHDKARKVFDVEEYDVFRKLLGEQTTIADAQALLMGKQKHIDLEEEPVDKFAIPEPIFYSESDGVVYSPEVPH